MRILNLNFNHEKKLSHFLNGKTLTPMLKSSLCDYSDAYTFVSSTITIT